MNGGCASDGAAGSASNVAASGSHASGSRLPPGTTVWVTELKSRPELNGRTASVLSFNETTQRYNISISSSST
eukprot:1498433-Pleurochrysis_carterae.AAC.1